jgi:hypothetical protein
MARSGSRNSTIDYLGAPVRRSSAVLEDLQVTGHGWDSGTRSRREPRNPVSLQVSDIRCFLGQDYRAYFLELPDVAGPQQQPMTRRVRLRRILPQRRDVYLRPAHSQNHRKSIGPRHAP